MDDQTELQFKPGLPPTETGDAGAADTADQEPLPFDPDRRERIRVPPELRQEIIRLQVARDRAFQLEQSSSRAAERAARPRGSPSRLLWVMTGVALGLVVLVAVTPTRCTRWGEPTTPPSSQVAVSPASLSTAPIPWTRPAAPEPVIGAAAPPPLPLAEPPAMPQPSPPVQRSARVISAPAPSSRSTPRGRPGAPERPPGPNPGGPSRSPSQDKFDYGTL